MLLNMIIYVVTVSFLLGLAAWAFERAVRSFAFPTRWIWVGAMGGSLGYMLLAVLRPATSSPPLGTVVSTPLDALLVPVVGSITRLAEASPSGINIEALLGVGWVVLTLSVTAVLLRAHLRLRSDRSTWTPAELDGRDVLVSEDLGPGVVGWIRSVIVMPRWAFGMPAEERELMLQHEGEHCNAGDTRLAGLALLLLMLLPWNLPLWWQVHRLRLAIEIDCDHRVLHRSADVKRYAMLLVEISARGTASRLSALAFARPIPSIERRILAMTDTRDDPRYIRMIGLTLLAALLVVASCQVEQVSITIDVEQVTPGASAGASVPRVITIELLPTPEQIRARADEAERVVDQTERVAELEAELEELLRTRRAERFAEIDDDITSFPTRFRDDPVDDLPPPPTDDGGTDLSAAPRFTPMTVVPEILNRSEIVRALTRLYPSILRDNGIGGTVEVWFFISTEGRVLDSRVSVPSPHTQLNEAALEVANIFRFSPALNRETIVPVWIQLPITFEVAQN